MAYETNNKEVEIGNIVLSECVELRVKRIEKPDGELESIDIRQWYCTRTDPTMKPTQKGVRVKKEYLGELIAMLESNRG